MSDLTLAKSIYLDGERSGGPDASLDGEASNPPSTPYSFIVADRFPLNVYFRKRSTENGNSTALNPPTGSTCVVAGRTSSGALLFAELLTVSGDHYTGTLDLTPAAVAAAVSTLAFGGAADLFLDFETKNAGETNTLTFRANCKLYKQVYDGTTPAGPVTVPPTVAVSPDGSRWRMDITNDGALQPVKVA